MPDRGGLTRAGRALDKHGNRPGSPFPRAVGKVSDKNWQGQFHLDDILTDPKIKWTQNEGGSMKIYSTDGRGAFFEKNGTFICPNQDLSVQL